MQTNNHHILLRSCLMLGIGLNMMISLAADETQKDKFRTWTSAKSDHSFEAELVFYTHTDVCLRGVGDKILNVENGELSEGDLTYVRTHPGNTFCLPGVLSIANPPMGEGWKLIREWDEGDDTVGYVIENAASKSKVTVTVRPSKSGDEDAQVESREEATDEPSISKLAVELPDGKTLSYWSTSSQLEDFVVQFHVLASSHTEASRLLNCRETLKEL